MSSHYYSEKQTSALKIKKINAFLRGNKLEFFTASGIFSKDRIDKGTVILINSCIINDNWSILDLGCGYGAVGISINKSFPKTSITISDINERALKLAEMNVKINNINNDSIKIIKSDGFNKIKEKFNTILVNPPQTAGKDICFKLISDSKNHLKEKGLLQLVARHNKGGEVLSKNMKQVFGNVAEITKKSGYRVYVSENT